MSGSLTRDKVRLLRIYYGANFVFSIVDGSLIMKKFNRASLSGKTRNWAAPFQRLAVVIALTLSIFMQGGTDSWAQTSPPVSSGPCTTYYATCPVQIGATVLILGGVIAACAAGGPALIGCLAKISSTAAAAGSTSVTIAATGAVILVTPAILGRVCKFVDANHRPVRRPSRSSYTFALGVGSNAWTLALA